MGNTRSVFITGASTGIGRSIALDLAAAGWRVFGTVRREQDGRELTAATPTGASTIEAVEMDVRDADAVAAAAATVAQSLGGDGLDALVNNAGISVAAPLEYLPIEAFELQMDVNVSGVLRCTQAFLPLLKAARGRIVNISSLSGRVGFPMIGAYSCSKHALEGLSDCLRLELRQFGVEVVVIQPGSIATPIWERSRERAARLASAIPPGGREQYAAMLGEVQRSTESNGTGAADPRLCADAVRRALTARRPRTRYLVGKDARRLLFLRRWFLSDRMLDRLTLRHMGLD
jgi:NAD(P)-dependent dehydrogenase (short-subunit alcohol dehydrogenase family)